MIYIIEGVDGSGKTTLARQLSAQTNTKILHMSNPKTTAEMLGMYDMYEKTLRANKSLILDRAWYSEMAYGPVMRDRSQIDWLQMYELERQAAKAGGAMIIHCTGPRSKMWARAQRRGEDFMTSRDAFDKVHHRFNEIMMAPHIIPVVTYEVPNA